MSDQSNAQRERMIGLLSDPHGDLGVLNGLIESADLREHNGEVGLRDRRPNDGPKAFIAPGALECDVPLEEGDCVAELAPG